MSNEPDSSKFYTVKEVSSILEVTPLTIRRWYRGGKLKIIRLPGGKIRISRSELERIMKEI